MENQHKQDKLGAQVDTSSTHNARGTSLRFTKGTTSFANHHKSHFGGSTRLAGKEVSFYGFPSSASIRHQRLPSGGGGGGTTYPSQYSPVASTTSTRGYYLRQPSGRISNRSILCDFGYSQGRHHHQIDHCQSNPMDLLQNDTNAEEVEVLMNYSDDNTTLLQQKQIDNTSSVKPCIVTFYHGSNSGNSGDAVGLHEQGESVKFDNDEEASIPSSTSSSSNSESDEEQQKGGDDKPAKTKQQQQKQREREREQQQTSQSIQYYKQRIRKSLSKYVHTLKALKLIQVCCALYIGLITFSNKIGPQVIDPQTKLIIDYNNTLLTEKGMIMNEYGIKRAIVAATHVQVILLAIARLSAFFMYPALVMVFISKFRASITFLSTTLFGIYMPTGAGDMHELHIYCGYTILICSIVHTMAHITRWLLQGNLSYLTLNHYTGISGLTMIVSCLLICLPMMITYLKQNIKYEIRKTILHYLFLVMGIALCFHTTPTSIPNGGFTLYVFASLLVWWLVDNLYCSFVLTEQIETTQFDILPTGFQMTMNVSPKFQQRGSGGYCYICIPWINKNEWHAFSLFENPINPTQRQIFVQNGGDWTRDVLNVLHGRPNTVRPVWIQGPYPSPYEHSIKYDNQILVASGIGITPALSAIRSYKQSRRVNLIWCVRDKYLLEFMLRQMYLDDDGWNLIYYTGKEPLDEDNIEIFTNTNICIINGRPNLHQVIPNIICGIESKTGLPENYAPEHNTKEALQKQFEMTLGEKGRDEEEDDICMDLLMPEFERIASDKGYEVQGGEHLTREMKAYARQSMALQRTKSKYVQGQTNLLLENIEMGYQPWETSSADRADGPLYVKGLDRQKVIDTWGIMYCGGAKVIEKQLRAISKEYGLGIHVESFGW